MKIGTIVMATAITHIATLGGPPAAWKIIPLAVILPLTAMGRKWLMKSQ